MTTRSLLPLAALLTLSGCKSLLHEPWKFFRQEQQTVGVSTGWTFIHADASLDPPSSGVGPIDESDSAQFDFDTTYVAGARHEYYLADNWILGTRIEWRGYHGQTFEIANRDIAMRDYGTMHFIESLWYLFDPIDEAKRWRPFGGLELSYVPEIDFRADVSGPDGDSAREKIRYRGSGLYNLGVTSGASYLWSDDTVLEVGALYEFPLGASEEQITFGDPLDPSATDWKLEPRGVVVFLSLMVSF